MIAEQYPGLLTRPDEEKLQLATELLSDVLGDAPEDDPTLVALVESRLAEYHRHPERVSEWSEVKARLLAVR
jgi:Putative addiction module component